jgi:hypothetical protein
MRRQRFDIVGLTGRLAIVITLVLAVSVPGALTGESGRDLIVLWDDSISVQDAEWGPAWQRLIDTMETLPAESRVGVLRFAAGRVLEVPVSTDSLDSLTTTDGVSLARTGALDQTRTDLGAAVAAGLRLAEPGRGTALAVLSDGRDTAGQAETLLRTARDSGIPVYALLPDEKTAPMIREIRVAAQIMTGRKTPADVLLHSGTPVSGVLSLMLDGQIVGSMRLSLDANETVQVRFWINPRQPGSRVLRAGLKIDTTSRIIRREQGIEVMGPSVWLAVSREPQSSTAIEQLQASGWPILPVHPDEFSVYRAELGRLSGIILDDVAVSDLATADWSVIDRAIRESGISMLVLGGPDSFGAGGYRGSELEALLPVTAEATDSRPSAAVQFVIDSSGSMGEDIAPVSPMSFARRAVLETARTLGPNDQIGVIAFDVEPRVLLPLQRYADPVAAMTSVSQALGPAGGTRLRPALEAALFELEQSSTKPQLMVLVSDGFFDDDGLDDVMKSIIEREIELIVLAIGKGADLARIESLAGRNNVYPVHEVATLPLLMRTEVERRRNPMYIGPVEIVQTRPIPFLIEPVRSWPGLTGFMRTRARPSATVYLQAHSGDPLLAARQSGMGRVAVLPAGLAEWAADWRRWPDRDALLIAMLRWLGRSGGDGNLFASLRSTAGNFTVTVDAIGGDRDWSTAADIAMTMVDPGQRITKSAMPQIAPGRYQTVVPARQAGRYLITVTDGDHQLQRAIFRDDALEIQSQRQASPAASWLREGLLQPWPENEEPLAFGGGIAKTRIYPGLLLAVLVFYCALIIYPRRTAFSGLPVRLRWQINGE